MARLVAIQSAKIQRVAYGFGVDPSRADLEVALELDWDTIYGQTELITNDSYRAEIGDDWDGTQGVQSAEDIQATLDRDDPVIQTTTGSALTISLADKKRHHHVILEHNVTSIALVDVPGVGTYEVEFIQDAVGGRTVTGWSGNVVWAEGTAPTLEGAANTGKLTRLHYQGPSQDLYFGSLEIKYLFPTTAVFLAEINNTSTAGAVTVDWNYGQKQRLTLSENVTSITFVEPPGIGNFMLKIIQDSTPRTVTGWAGSVLWPGGTDPTISVGSGAIDLLAFYYDGTNWFAVASQNFL